MVEVRVIEKYSVDGVRTGFGFLPVSCLVEDQDGFRFVITDEPTLGTQEWASAVRAGVVGLYTRGGIVTTAQMLEREDKSRHAVTIPAPTLLVPPGPWLVMQATTSDPAPTRLAGRFVHLHAHTEFSALDGLTTVDEMVAMAVADGQPAMAVTDHGSCAAHPHFFTAARKAGIKPILGIEAYFVPDRFDRDKDKLYSYWHLILLAADNTGLRNIWSASTEANREGAYLHPRMDWDTLARHSEGVICSTGCLRGPLAQPLTVEDDTAARINLARLRDIFGDRLYVEIHTNALPAQIAVNQALVGLAHDYSVPIIAAVDSHYATADDRQAHQVWIAAQTNKTLHDESDLFSSGCDYHVFEADEVVKALDDLPADVVAEAMSNTVAVANLCDASIGSKAAPPVFTASPQADADRLERICRANWAKLDGKGDPQVYEDRFAREIRLLIDKQFCGYYCMVIDQVLYAKEHGILVGPGRGSGAASLVAYLAGITEVDPVEAGLLFERFLTEGRSSMPDFDVDYPSSRREEMTAYITERWGADRVVRVGTHIRLKNKGVVRDMARVLGPALDAPRLWPDMEAVAAIIDLAEMDTAGLGKPWDELWVEQAELLDPFRERYPEVFHFADRLVGRLKTYGKHAAGFIISADAALTDALPLRKAGEQLVAEFDMDALEGLGLIKFDLLNLRTLDTLQKAVDLIREQRGHQIDLYAWGEEYDDPLVWEQICDGHTLGIFQIETKTGTRLVKRLKPTSVRELCDAITLVRPGPSRSGLTDAYLRRRAGEEPVSLPDERLAAVLADTYGCIIYQEQVMAVCQILAGYTLSEADEVRRILGKKKVELVATEGERFIERCVTNGVERDAAAHLWAQLAEFARYSFNKSHSWAYALLGYWACWIKTHYPVQFMTALLSTEDKDQVPACVTEVKRLGFSVMPPDINESRSDFTSSAMVIRYGFSQVKGIGPKAVADILVGAPYTSFDDYLARKGRNANSAVTTLLVRVGAFDSLHPDRRALEARIRWTGSPDSTRCQHKDESHLGPGGLPCRFDWASEPVVLTPTGKAKAAKPPPKRCTTACRQYLAPDAPSDPDQAYTEADIRDLEMELLGVYLSSSPFDRLPEDVRAECITSSGLEEAPPAVYLVCGIVTKARPTKDRNGRGMAFVTLEMPDGEVDAVVFHKTWAKYGPVLRMGYMMLAEVRLTGRGLQLERCVVV